ncbi:MAG: hypothetical protein AB7U79_08475 [Candidatus Izemoplasmatales bacterium]
MNKVYNVAGITLTVDYLYPDLLEKSLEQYITSEEANYHIRVSLIDHFDIPKTEPSIIYKNRFIYELEEESIYVIYDKTLTRISHVITYQNEGKDISLYLMKSSTKNLVELEYLLTGIFFYEIALKEGFIILHASAVKQGEEVYLFSSPSGGGKSTMAELFLKEYPESTILNDDKPIIKQRGNEFYVYGTPWSGKTQTNMNDEGHLHSIIFLKQAPFNQVSPLSPRLKIEQMYRNMFRPREEAENVKVATMVEKCIARTRIIQYEFINHPSAAQYIYKWIKKEQIK